MAGWLPLAGFALLVWSAYLFSTGGDNSAALALGLLVTLAGLIAFAAALGSRGETDYPRAGVVLFAIASLSFIVGGQIGRSTGQFPFMMEWVYTVLACVTMVLFGWSIVRSRAVPSAVGWFAIVLGVLFGVLFVTRIVIPPLGPNLVNLVFGLALVLPRRSQ